MLFWWPVIGSPPLPSPLGYPARMAYTFLAWLPNSLLGAGITLVARRRCTRTTSRPARPTASTPLYDQQLAGLIMWMPGDVLFVTILMLLFVAYMQARRTHRKNASTASWTRATQRSTRGCCAKRGTA